MRRDWIRSFTPALPVAAGIVATLVIVGLERADPSGLATQMRERAFDAILTHLPRRATAKVVVVDIDQQTLARFGDWPLARSDLADLTKIIAAAQPAAIGFDIFFEGPDRRSARTLAEEISKLPGGDAIGPLAAQMPDNDKLFADVLAQGPSVLGALAAPAGSADGLNPIRVEGRLNAADLADTGGLAQPFAPLAQAALGIGVQSLIGEEGGTVRRAPLLVAAGDVLAPGLAAETARIATKASLLDVDAAAQSLKVGAQNLPLNEGGSLRIHWSAPAKWPERTVSAADVIDGKIGTERFASATVMIGASAPEAGALRPTAVSPLTPTVQIEADAVAQILDGDAPVRKPYASAIESGAGIALGLIAAVIAAAAGPLIAGAALIALGLAWIAGCVVSFASADVLVDPVGPLVPIIAAGILAGALSYARTRHLKALITGRFAQYVAPAVVAEIVAHPERLKREGAVREVTALFTDVEDFTALTARLDARLLIALLDRYFVGICAIVTEHDGLIDAIAGDAVHVLFNVPLEQSDHADRALDCAVAIARFADTFGSEPDVSAASFGRTRIGIESGPAIVGDVGGAGRLNFTAHGNVINMAARLEGANKLFGSTICVGPGAAKAARRTKLKKLGEIELRGVAEVCAAFTVAE